MEKAIANLIKYINNKYQSFEMENINNHKNVRRYTKHTMAGYVENGIALLIDDILSNKKLYYLIDSQISVGERQPIRPDILIYDENNVIHCIVEVKSQLGYSGGFKKDNYNNKIKKIKKASKKGLLKLKKDKIDFIVSDNCLDLVVILMNANSHGNAGKFKDVNSFVLFSSNKNDLWYDNLSINYLNMEENGFYSFCNFIKKIGD